MSPHTLSINDWTSMVMGHIARSWYCGWVPTLGQELNRHSITPELVRQVLDEETAKIRESVGEEVWQRGRPAETREIFDRVALAQELIEFLTIPAYSYLD